MIDVYDFFQNPVLFDDKLEDDRGDAHIIDYTHFLRDMDADPFWPFEYEAA